MTDVKFLTPPQVARILGTDAGRVLTWIRSGALKAANLSEGDRPRWKINPDDLQRFLDTRSNQPRQAKRAHREIPKPARNWV
jgi:predicted site-specific integrase-resolvase